MNTIIPFFVAISVSSVSLAQISIFKPNAKEYQYQAEERERTNGIAGVLPAVRNYSIDGGKCSLVVTSKSCYALTAAHCLQGMLAKAGKVQWQQISKGENPLGFGYVKDGVLPTSVQIDKTMQFKFLTNGEKSRAVVDAVSRDLTELEMKALNIDSVLKQKQLQNEKEGAGVTGVEISFASTNAKILAIGRGFPNRTVSPAEFKRTNALPDYENVLSDSDSYFKFVQDSRSMDLADYALVKIPGENCTCAKTGDLQELENVVVAGFSKDAKNPVETADFAMGTQYGPAQTPFSYGEQCSELESSAHLLTSQMNILGKAVFYTIAGNALYALDQIGHSLTGRMKKELIVSNARAAQGASGGAMFNTSGQLVGITTMVLQHASGQKTVGLRVSEIKNQLKKTVDEQTLSEAFRCE